MIIYSGRRVLGIYLAEVDGDGKVQLVGRAPSPSPTLVLLLKMKKTSARDIIKPQEALPFSQERKS